MNEPFENTGVKYEFGKFVLDPQERILLSDGEPTHLSDKVFETLLMLVRHNGQLLTKDEMMSSIWEESFVEEGNLAKNISRLRKILNTDGSQLIETLPKRGYRFRAEIREIGAETDLLVHRRVRIRVSQTSSHGRETSLVPAKPNVAGPALDEIHSIAVLPFQPLGAKADDDFFGLGMTDALITQLTRAGQIQVRPTSSILKFNVPEQDAITAGRELQVDAILQGNFQRLGKKLRLTVQMLRSRNGDSIWADSFHVEVEDIFEVQDRIAGRVVGALNEKLSDEAQAQLTKRDTQNVEAYEQYLKGRSFYNQRTTEGYDVAIECFEKAIAIDPEYALAHAGLADIYNLLPVYDGFAPRDYFPKAKASALKALFLDGDLAEAHAALGLAILHYDWNWAGAEVSFRNSVKLDPNYAAAYQLLGVYFLRVDRIGDALIALQKARELDPFSPINAVWLAEVLRHYGETDASIRLHVETLESFPDFFLAHYHLAFAYMDAGRFDQAEVHRDRAVELSHENSLTLSMQGILQAAVGNTTAAQQTLDKLLRMKSEKYVSSANIASVYAALRNEAKAIEWLEIGLKERDPNLTWIKFDKEFDFLKPYPRFQAVLQEVGLAERKLNLIDGGSLVTSSWKPFAILAILSAIIVFALAIHFLKGGQKFSNEDIGELRLTDDPKHDNRAYWTNDGRIRFFRSGTGNDRQVESWIMNSDGSNQTVVKDFASFEHGVWSPDGSKVIFWKRGDRTAMYLASADGSNEMVLPFIPGNLDWSPDARRIAYQANVKVGDPDIFIYSLETKESVNVTNNSAFDSDPNFSPDGTQIVFASLRDGNAEIYLMNADGGNVRRLTNHPGWDNHPVFSPDGTGIAFNSDREDENSDVYLMNADGTGLRHLTDLKNNESVEPGCWSPDGTRIAFYSDRFDNDDIFVISAEVHRPRLIVADGEANLQFPMYSQDGKKIVYQADLPDKTGELRLYDLETKRSSVLLESPHADLAPAFSPDGEWIAFHSKIESNTEIYVIRPDGKDLTNLTQHAARDFYPMFSPDGKQIAFASNRDGNYGGYNLFVMNLDGGGQRLIHSDKLGMSVEPAWSPDGRELIFANDREDGATGNFEIFKIRLDQTGVAQRLTVRRRADGHASFSPDGKRIVFNSTADGNAEIYLMNSDGTGLIRITRNPADDKTPRFSGDGQRIIFSSNRDGKFALYEIDVAE